MLMLGPHVGVNDWYEAYDLYNAFLEFQHCIQCNQHQQTALFPAVVDHSHATLCLEDWVK